MSQSNWVIPDTSSLQSCSLHCVWVCLIVGMDCTRSTQEHDYPGNVYAQTGTHARALTHTHASLAQKGCTPAGNRACSSCEGERLLLLGYTDVLRDGTLLVDWVSTTRLLLVGSKAARVLVFYACASVMCIFLMASCDTQPSARDKNRERCFLFAFVRFFFYLNKYI